MICIRFLMGITLLASLAGCGQSGPEAISVSGKVTFEGQAVENGKIRFLPMKGTTGPVTGARIENGQYQITNKGGVPVGKHRVEIEAFRQRGAGTNEEQAPGAGGAEFVQFIPPKYNTRSELIFTVEPGRGPVVENFELTR